jgi:serine/threonine protein kinase
MSRDKLEQRAIQILLEALDIDPSERKAFISSATSGHPDLQERVEALLDREKDASTFLESGDAALALPRISPDEFETLVSRDRERIDDPERIGDFQIVKRIGVGGMGVVYLAEQEKPLRRSVALKVIKLGMDTREVITRFEAERQALALMNHPGIARAFDAGATDDGRPYFVMEYVEGRPILDRCDQERLDVHGRLEVFVMVCDAIQHAHAKGIVHRDIKPSNVLVDFQNGLPSVKVIDFGIAKATNQRLTEETFYTEVGRVTGTPTYMSPEQAMTTDHGVDFRTDIFSLGVLLYELLVDDLPYSSDFASMSFDEVRRCIVEDEPSVPSTRWSRLSAERRSEIAGQRRTTSTDVAKKLRGDLDWIVMKALEKDPGRRYASAEDFARDVRRFLTHDTVVARPPSRICRAQKFVRKNGSVVVAIALIILSLMLGLVATAWFAVESGQRLKVVLRLSDMKKLGNSRDAIDELWPANPDQIPGMESWLARAQELVGRLEKHRETLDSLRSRARTSTDGEWIFDDTDLQWHHDSLEDLIRELETFSNIGETRVDPGGSTVAAVVHRLHLARSLAERQKSDEFRHAWDLATRSISNPDECPVYGGLKVHTKGDLLPLGRDPRSGLWESAHLQSGEVPSRDDSGLLVMTESSAIVFVLVPGEKFTMGAVPSDSEAESDEKPLGDVALAPFFMSKYERTQSQWARVAGDHPSRFGPDSTLEKSQGKIDLGHPVESVSWKRCATMLHRYGMVFPTEAQWEYAARAGTKTIWWSGDAKESLRDRENLADASYCAYDPRGQVGCEEWDDHHVVHALEGRGRKKIDVARCDDFYVDAITECVHREIAKLGEIAVHRCPHRVIHKTKLDPAMVVGTVGDK